MGKLLFLRNIAPFVAFCFITYYPFPPHFRVFFPPSRPNAPNEGAWNCLADNKSELAKLANKKSPFYSLPPYGQLLLPISATISICNPVTENLHVLAIFSQPSLIQTRNAIRKTYTNFSFHGNEQQIGNWTKFFLVGKPNGERESMQLENEVAVFGDVVVANLDESYWNLTLKALIAMKFTSCFCQNAAYFLKTDDDSYINVGMLHNTIQEFQQETDKQKFSIEMDPKGSY